MKKRTPEQPLEMSQPAWQSVALVCQDCRKRGSGPKKLKPKSVAGELKRSLREKHARPRIVLVSCLGVCPKGAMAVAVATGTGPLRVAHVGALAQLAEVAPWFDPPPRP